MTATGRIGTDARETKMSRREAVRLLGAGTGLCLAAAWDSGAALRAAGSQAAGQDASSKEIAGRGAFLGFDTVGHRMSASFIPEREKVDMVLNALEAGYEDHILLSSDFANTTQIKANWGNGFSTVLVQFVPKLRFYGVPEETIRKILVDNPRRWLAHVPGTA